MEFISPLEVQKLVANKDAILIDIREKYELDICKVCKIEGIHIPMGKVIHELEGFSKDKAIVLMCRSGKRAEALANFLEIDHEFENISVMENGILGWIEQVENQLETY